MKNLNQFQWNSQLFLQEFNEFELLLKDNQELKENEHILPFFKNRLHLSAFIGSYVSRLNRFDLIKHEFDFFGDFRADLVIGDSVSNHYCFIEFEDATKNSIFEEINRGVSKWGTRFDRGFSQIIDWFWNLEDNKNRSRFRDAFGSNQIHFFGVLVIGRDQFLTPIEQERLQWRSAKVLIDSRPIICVTFDQLASDLSFASSQYRLMVQDSSISNF
jgi:hypothetical protein